MRAYRHSYDDAVVSSGEAGTVLKAKVSGMKTQLLAKLCFLLLCRGKNNHITKEQRISQESSYLIIIFAHI